MPTEAITADDLVLVRRHASHAVELSRLRRRFQRRQKSVWMGSSRADTVRSVDSTGYRFAAAMSRHWLQPICLTANGVNSRQKANRLHQVATSRGRVKDRR